MAHINATINEKNQTLTGGHVSHVGQLFFDQKLIDEAESVAPYTTNTQVLLLNAQDRIFANEAATSDPVLNYVYLGEGVEDGVFGWVTVGIDPTAVKTPSPAVGFGENGGVIIPGGGPRPPAGAAPPGAPTQSSSAGRLRRWI